MFRKREFASRSRSSRRSEILVGFDKNLTAIPRNVSA